MKKIGIYPNLRKKPVREALPAIVGLVRKTGLEPFLPEEIAAEYGCGSYRTGVADSAGPDVYMSLGGDGTLLRMASLLAAAAVPGFGVNFGRLGFLAEIEYGELQSALQCLVQGRYVLEKRRMVRAQVLRNGQELLQCHALNDIVVSKAKVSKMAHYVISVNGLQAACLGADGIIVATATGSTAYSLSAGGPLVDPRLGVTVVTPICPHSLTNRPWVVPIEAEVCIETERDGEQLMLEKDGILVGTVEDDSIVRVSESPYCMQLLRLPNGNYYDRLQDKLAR